MDDFGLLVGRFFTTLPTLTNEELSELQLDSSGRLIISGRYLEDSAHTSGDAGIFVMAVANHTEGALHSADGDYAALQVDSSGRLRVIADVDINGLPSEKLEDAAHSSGDSGMYILAVRSDSRPTNANTSATGDYASIFVNASGELWVKDADTLAQLVTIDSVLDTIKTDTAALVVDAAAIETELLDQGTTLDTIAGDTTSMDATLTALSKSEDAAHSSGDQGIQALAVRQDAEGAAAADGDYTSLHTDDQGRLKVSAVTAAPGSEQFSVTDALAGGGDGLATITAAATPWVTVASYAHTSGTAYVFGWQWACDQNAQARLVTDVSGTVTYYKTDINSSSEPGKSEHFADNGRIEIAGVANQEIRVQVKKRSSTGGNANGTGSMHIRNIT